MKNQNGFTLVELMVVLGIVAIITSIAVPSYQSYVLRGARSEGMTVMLDIMRAQEDFFANNFTYTKVLTDLNYTATVVTSSGRYSISASECTGMTLTSCVQLTGIAQNGQQTDGPLVLDSLGTRSRNGVAGWTK